MSSTRVSSDNGEPKPRRTRVTNRRARRSTAEIVERIMAAALEEFEEGGFSGTRTAAIARRAGVVEALIFNHFGSKENLFQRTIFERLDRHFNEFASEHDSDLADNASRMRDSREFIAAQQDFLRRNQRIFRSLLVNEAYGGMHSTDVPALSGLNAYLDKMVGIVASRSGSAEKVSIDLTARISFATVLACALFGDWLFPEGIAEADEIKAAVTDFVMEGAKTIV